LKIIVFISLLITFSTLAQKNRIVSFENDTPERVNLLYKKKFKDSLSLLKRLQEERLFDIEKGYALANVDSVVWTKAGAHIYYFKGAIFEKIHLNLQEDDKNWLFESTGMTEKLIQKLPFNSKDLKQLIQTSLSYSENNGYPFANLKLSDAYFEKNELHVLRK